jgi:hypothetical protein
MTAWREVEKHWTEHKLSVRSEWPRLTNAEIHRIRGKRNVLAKSLESDYGITHGEAEAQIDWFLKGLAPLKGAPEQRRPRHET